MVLPTSATWDGLVGQLKAVDTLGDVYEKKKRLRRIIGDLESLAGSLDQTAGIDPAAVKRTLDKARQDEEDIQIAETELDSQKPHEVVGDIDELLGGLTIEDDAGSAPVHRPVSGRRYKKVVRASGKQRQYLARARQKKNDAEEDDTGSVDGCHASVPMRAEEDGHETTTTTDEEGKRYVMPVSRDRLTVEIPIQHDVIARAQQRHGMAADRGSSGSTHARGGGDDAHHHGEGDAPSSSYDSDESITSPAAGTVLTFHTTTTAATIGKKESM